MGLFDPVDPTPRKGAAPRPLADRMRPETLEEFAGQEQILAPGKALRRQIESDKVASLILFLASDRAGWMTGETIPIDGGRHLTCAR